MHATERDPDEPSGPAAAPPLVVVTYNVHAGVGLDGRTDIARIADVLAELDPDVVALQEVMSADGVDAGGQVAAVAERLGMTAAFGRAMCRTTGPYGNAILTRLRVSDTRSVDISIPGHEPRCLMEVVLEHAGRALRVMNTHLGVRVRERHAQLARCAPLFAAGDDDRPLLVMGDFNSWLPRGDVLAKLRMHFGAHAAPRSFPVRRPIFALDRLWSRPMSLLHDVRAHTSAAARVASDHLPVWGRLSLD